MCKVLFVAAATRLPLLPKRTPPAPLSVQDIEDRDAPVQAQFTHAHVFFTGAYTGCSCGFTPQRQETITVDYFGTSARPR